MADAAEFEALLESPRTAAGPAFELDLIADRLRDLRQAAMKTNDALLLQLLDITLLHLLELSNRRKMH